MRLCAALRSSLSMESLSFLAKSCAGFGVHGSQVKVLTQPSQFYEELCQRAASSQKRIVLVNILVSYNLHSYSRFGLTKLTANPVLLKTDNFSYLLLGSALKSLQLRFLNCTRQPSLQLINCNLQK